MRETEVVGLPFAGDEGENPLKPNAISSRVFITSIGSLL